MIENPPWVTKLLKRYWDQLEGLVGRDKMPWPGKKGQRPREYGSGSYGTVMPTVSSGTVMKVTSDPSEGLFVAAALSIGQIPRGLVQYERIVALPETHRGRPVFVIWRQEAFDVEFLVDTVRGGYFKSKPDEREAVNLIYSYKTAATVVRKAILARGPKAYEEAKPYEHEAFEFVAENFDSIDPDDPKSQEGTLSVLSMVRGGLRLAIALRFCEVAFEMMHHNNPVVTDVGTALEFYLSKNILLADVHLRNIGKVKVVESGHEWDTVAITDPGHAVFLTEEYDKVEIPTLGERALVTNASRYEFVGDCTGMDGDVINYMKSRDARPDQIDFDEFESVVGSDVAREYEKEAGVSMNEDWNVTFWKSRLPSGTPVIYWTQSNIERVYAPRGVYDETEERRVLDVLDAE